MRARICGQTANALLVSFARELGITPAQLALAWLLRQGEGIVPIPGSGKKESISENARAASIGLNAADLKRIDPLAPRGAVRGGTLPVG